VCIIQGFLFDEYCLFVVPAFFFLTYMVRIFKRRMAFLSVKCNSYYGFCGEFILSCAGVKPTDAYVALFRGLVVVNIQSVLK